MAGGGMAYIAMQSCLNRRSNSCPEQLPVDVSAQCEHIEITALSAEKSAEAVQILQERHIASKPLKAYAKVCTQQIVGKEDETQSKLKRPDAGRSFLTRHIAPFIPIITWLPQVNRTIVKADLIAGLTVGVMVIPQSMSYGAIAGLPYINGLYSACIPTVVYAFFGQSRQLAVGPVAMVSLLVNAGLQGQLSAEDCPAWDASSAKLQSEVCQPQYVNLACLTAAVVGLMQIMGSILRLGFLVSFLGHPVTSGFTSGAAIIIGLSQLKDILGFEVAKSQYVHEMLQSIGKGIHKTQPLTVFLGVVFFVYLVINKYLARRYRRLRMLQPLGPLVSCVLGSLLLLVARPLIDDFHVKYVGKIPEGIMPVSVTGFRIIDMQKVLPTALSVTLIGYMESIAIGKNLAAQHGYDIDAGQEMLALGIANLFGSALSCYPVTGSFSRSAVANSTGALSQLCGLITGVLMFCTLMFLTPLFYYLPKLVLAAIVLNSVIPLVAFEEAKRLWRAKKHDFVLWVVAFIGTLFLGVLIGILVAVSLSMAIIIYESARPQITILWRIPGTTIYRNVKQESSGSFVPNVFITRIGSSLYFANASFVKDMLLTYVSDLEDFNPTEYLVLEMTPVVSIDTTACHVLHDIVEDFRSGGIEVAFAMVGNRVDRTMRNTELKKFIGEKWFFANVNEAVQFCLRHQHTKKRLASRTAAEDIEEQAQMCTLDIQEIDIGCSDEIGFSNDMHSENTMAFIALSQDVPMIMSDITAIFRRSGINIIRAQIEPLDNKGAKHVYFLRSVKSGSKLSNFEIATVQDELEALINDIKRSNARDAAGGDADAVVGPDGARDVACASVGLSAECMSLACRSAARISEDPQEKLACLDSQVHEILKILRATGNEKLSLDTAQIHKTKPQATIGLESILFCPSDEKFDLESAQIRNEKPQASKGLDAILCCSSDDKLDLESLQIHKEKPLPPKGLEAIASRLFCSMGN